jgi:hypothetical protein
VGAGRSVRCGVGLGLALGLLPACQEQQAANAGRVDVARARGEVVARVDGSSVGLDEVRELCERMGLTPREALSRLVDERLLAKEALRRGYQRTTLSPEETKRMLVQALLAREIEARHAPESLTQAELRARFDLAAPRMNLAADAFPSHQAEIRDQITLERRSEALEKLLTQLRAAFPVQLDESQVQKLLNDESLWTFGT